MTANDPRDTPALIGHILERFHEGHRHDLPALIRLARRVDAELAEHLEAMNDALEEHMFKEEARLFPMMEQGGHALIGNLIDDLQREHRAHDVSIATLRRKMAAQPLPETLATGLARFIGELEAHVQIEDDVLFPRFMQTPGLRPLA